MITPVTRDLRHIRRNKGGKEIVSSKNYYKEIQKSIRKRYVADNWVVNYVTYWIECTVYEMIFIKYRTSIPPSIFDYYRKIGKQLTVLRIGFVTVSGEDDLKFHYESSTEYFNAMRYGIRDIYESYGRIYIDPDKHKFIDKVYIEPVPLRYVDYDKNRPTHFQPENKDDWYFKNDVETNFSR